MAVGETPFGRRIHWVGAAYDEPDGESVFGAMDGVNGPWSKLRQSCGIETAPVYGIDFDPDLLKAMFSKKDQSKPNAGRQRQIARKPQGITVLDATRAQNMAIVISKLKVSCQDICRSLHDLDFFDQNVTIDDVELLIQVLPTPDESKKLLEHQHIVEQLRDVEQKMMHFCVLPKSVVRLRLMKFALSHATTYSSLLWRCKVLGYAAEEVHMSVQLKELLSVILRVGNFINYGVEQACTQGTVRAFAIESLGSLASFKTGAVSTLHFLCLSMRSADPTFFKAFKEGLVHVHEAARENVALLKSAIQAFDKEVEFAKLQGKMLLAKEEGPAQSAFDKEVEFAKLQGKMLLAKCSWQKSEGFADTTDSPEDRMNQLAALLQTGNSELQSKLAEVLVSCTEVQVYFSISEKAKANLSPFELFCGHISTFDEQLGAAWQEIERNPRRWQQFASAADSGNAARHKFASDARQQFASASRARRKSLPGGRLSEEQTEALRNNGDEEGRARAMTGGVGEGRAGAMTEEEITSRGHAPLLDVSQAPPVSRTSARSRAASAPSETASRRSSGKRTPFQSPSRSPSPLPVGEESLEPAQGKRPPPKGSGKAVKGPPLVKGAPKGTSIPPPAKGPGKGVPGQIDEPWAETAAEPPEEGAARKRTPRTVTGSKLQSNLGQDCKQEMLPEKAWRRMDSLEKALLEQRRDNIRLQDMLANLLGSQRGGMGAQELPRSRSPPRHRADRTQDIAASSRAKLTLDNNSNNNSNNDNNNNNNNTNNKSSWSSRSSLTLSSDEELGAQPIMEVESKEQLDQNEDREDMETTQARTPPGPNSDIQTHHLPCHISTWWGTFVSKQSCKPSWHSEQEQDKSPPTSSSRRLDLTRTRNLALTLDDAVLAEAEAESGDNTSLPMRRRDAWLSCVKLSQSSPKLKL
ncbi:unnamed protein product [Polarella glacialis]|uniref:FH2 domain-containing protein n=1 Tax=Polarella glacialis TaxID=89957 RepID=A0A813KHP0_POLGL|nr:unnamed protein product [Polarella glacialis]